MLDLLTNVKYLLKLEQVCIDNNVFRLHYKATAFLLAICSIIITSKQYIGDPIDCILDSSLDKEAINTYCWIFSTFTLGHRQHHNYRKSESIQDRTQQNAHLRPEFLAQVIKSIQFGEL